MTHPVASSSPDSQPGSGLIRRRAWLRGAGAIAGAGVGAFGWATCVEPFWLRIALTTLPILNLPDAWDGKRVVHASDLHLGSTNRRYLDHAMGTLAKLEPDLLILTGDMVDHQSPESIDELKKLLSPLRAVGGRMLACLGNHDYGMGWRDGALADRVCEAMGECGIDVLRNETRRVNGLQVTGLDDYWAGRLRPLGVFDAVNGDEAGFCLCHNPDVCDLPVWGRFRGVIFSGHTHGGQCKPPFGAPPRLPVHNRRYVAGRYPLDDRRQLFISRGVGYTRQARFNCRPEINVLTLSRVDADRVVG
ncbi:MAG: metallophosphoesterase [Planctomycetota bacterium]